VEGREDEDGRAGGVVDAVPGLTELLLEGLRGRELVAIAEDPRLPDVDPLHVRIELDRVGAPLPRAFLIVHLHGDLPEARAEAALEDGVDREVLKDGDRIAAALASARQERLGWGGEGLVPPLFGRQLLEQLAGRGVLRRERERLAELGGPGVAL